MLLFAALIAHALPATAGTALNTKPADVKVQLDREIQLPTGGDAASSFSGDNITTSQQIIEQQALKDKLRESEEKSARLKRMQQTLRSNDETRRERLPSGATDIARSASSIEDNFLEDKSLFPPICGCEGCRVSSNFGPRTDPVYGGSATHYGCDIAAPFQTKVYAPADGIVEDMIRSFKPNEKGQRGYGNQIVLKHRTPTGTTYLTRFGHLETVLVEKGSKVKKGQLIGTVDSTGKSTGHHLHFEVMKCKGDGGEKDDSCAKVDPSKYFDPKQTSANCKELRQQNNISEDVATPVGQ